MTGLIEANIKNKGNFSFQALKEFIKIEKIVLYYQKNFFLSEHIDAIIESWVATGVIVHIVEHYMEIRYFNVHEMEKGPKQLTFLHLRGAFYLWAVCCFICVIVFGFEIFSDILRKLRTNRNFVV